ncbi:MAG TPA: hypothetical protein VGQ52_20760 [Gemmatimonadaceae bacterium]|jgi:hypothetical protein|nr:hypothetical protein [Gemmatimonadaceae bacterium]
MNHTKTIKKLVPLMILALACSRAVQLQSGAPSAAKTTFFITSAGPGNGAALGGLAGADRHCQSLADAAGITGVSWRAYLSTIAAQGSPAVNARDRIGSGPWTNAKGVVVAQNVADLHSDNNKLSKENSITEKGAVVNGRGDTPNTHDILTGSSMDGRAVMDSLDTTCGNWTRSDSTGSAFVGHHDRQGGGQNPTSWNSAHKSRGCGLKNLQATGGNGLFYCFGAAR